MLKNKAQIARESIKTTLELPGPWTPAKSEFGSVLVMCLLTQPFAPPPPPNENPGSAPEELYSQSNLTITFSTSTMYFSIHFLSSPPRWRETKGSKVRASVLSETLTKT